MDRWGSNTPCMFVNKVGRTYLLVQACSMTYTYGQRLWMDKDRIPSIFVNYVHIVQDDHGLLTDKGEGDT